MTTRTIPPSPIEFAAAYQALRDWTMKNYDIRPAELQESSALSLRSIGLIVRRHVFQGYSVDLAPPAPIDCLEDYLRTLPNYSYHRAVSGQTEEALRSHARMLAEPVVQSCALKQPA